ncbi:hypothetical protein BB558_004799 [Smittium angustum]|uniref:Mago nashi protein n=1 Tax=Smittium angustum TaxID=133377 RepID=A0A2U1J2G9_SMIAN|nr:hypothetical protein BB558_004799 [Smittium angustum]
MKTQEFYLRYYVGHVGKFGHEFLEFEINSDGLIRYANNSNYRRDNLIRKKVRVSPEMIKEIIRIVEDSEITREDDSGWPEKDASGRQELEIRLGNEHISFEASLNCVDRN